MDGRVANWGRRPLLDGQHRPVAPWTLSTYQWKGVERVVHCDGCPVLRGEGFALFPLVVRVSRHVQRLNHLYLRRTHFDELGFAYALKTGQVPLALTLSVALWDAVESEIRPTAPDGRVNHGGICLSSGLLTWLSLSNSDLEVSLYGIVGN